MSTKPQWVIDAENERRMKDRAGMFMALFWTVVFIGLIVVTSVEIWTEPILKTSGKIIAEGLVVIFFGVCWLVAVLLGVLCTTQDI